ncbi:hypothetical protein [Paenibacillus sp. DCT19]|uniref:nSTAND1 domain-containing NTPase n=1 Tax=Paenibacillus sp. DCT19 TaxID=2211212 RepID=UPI000FE2687C|nr:hypothetical protein [Paenibacillus sp. DCT19]
MGNSGESRYDSYFGQGKRFVGRIRELNMLNHWFADSVAPLTIFSITGMGGIGKSSLLSEMMAVSRNQGATAIWMDGRFCGSTPSVFLDYLSSAVGLEMMESGENHPPLTHLRAASARNRYVIAVDNYEELVLLESWFLEVFVNKIPANGVLIILASRPEPASAWRIHPRLQQYLVQMPLQHFTDEEVTNYIAGVGTLNRHMAGKIARMTDGHPLGLALAVEAADQHCNIQLTEWAELSHMVSARLLHELTLPSLQPMVEVLTLLETANQELLSSVLQTEVTLQEYQVLKRMSFIRSDQSGVVLHDLARLHLLRDFRQREPQRLQAMRVRIAGILKPLHEKAEPHERYQITRKMLLLCQESMLQHRKYADVSADSLFSPMEAMRMEDMPALQQLLWQWCQYSVEPWQAPLYRDFLDELARRYPEGIVVMRDKSGEPTAMFITVFVHRESSEILLKYFPNEMQECFTPEELKCDPDQADTHYAVLVAARDDVPGYKREELVGYMALDRLSLLGDGSRVMLVATNPNLKLFLQSIGFQMRKTRTRVCDLYDEQADVLELDLRKEKFGDWVMSLLNTETLANGTSHTTAVKERTSWTETDVRKMLSLLHSPGELQLYAERMNGMENGIQFQMYVLDLLEGRTHGICQQDQMLLYAAYWTHAGNPTAAAQVCSMSRATFYRHLRAALKRLARVL